MKISLACLMVCLLLAAPAKAQQSPDLQSEDLKPDEDQPPALNQSHTDPQARLEALTAKAKGGDAAAQARLGAALRRGWPGSKDTFRALAWTRAAAEAGHFLGQANLAAHLYFGQGVDKDQAAAARLAALAARELKKAAEKGDPEMMTFMAWLRVTGLGVEQSRAKALEWLERAIVFNYPPAQTNLAVLLLTGAGGEADDLRAAHLLGRAAASKMAKAQYLLGRLHEVGRGVPKDPATAAEWFQLAADQGHKASAAKLQ